MLRQVAKRCLDMCQCLYDRAGVKSVCKSVCIQLNEWPSVPKANNVVINSLGQIREQTLCHHGYFIKLQTHKKLLACGGPNYCDKPYNLSHQPHINKTCSIVTWLYYVLWGKLEYGSAKTILSKIVRLKCLESLRVAFVQFSKWDKPLLTASLNKATRLKDCHWKCELPFRWLTKSRFCQSPMYIWWTADGKRLSEVCSQQGDEFDLWQWQSKQQN